MKSPVMTGLQVSNSDIERRFYSPLKAHAGDLSVRTEAWLNYTSHSLAFAALKQDL